jgi:hypothetical protein
MATNGFNLVNGSAAAFIDILCEEIVTHITTQATVDVTVAVASVTLVTPGLGVSGPGTGTGTGKIV